MSVIIMFKIDEFNDVLYVFIACFADFDTFIKEERICLFYVVIFKSHIRVNLLDRVWYHIVIFARSFFFYKVLKLLIMEYVFSHLLKLLLIVLVVMTDLNNLANCDLKPLISLIFTKWTQLRLLG